MSPTDRTVRILVPVVFWLVVFGVAPAHALTVEIDVPDELRPLLTRHLDASRAARLDETFSDEEITRLQGLSETSARALLATEGYFAPRILSTRRGDTLQFMIKPGARTEVRAVDIRFIGALADAPGSRPLQGRITRSFALKPGMPFRQLDWDTAKAGALAPLVASQYLAARIAESEVRIDPIAHVADITLTLDSGPAFFYGQPVINGASRYPVSIARKLAPMQPGQPVNQQDLLDYQAALEASGYYSQASVRIDPDPATAAAAPIRIEVVERPEKRLSLGAGVSTDTGARVQGEWLSRNIDNRGLRLRLDARLETTSQRAGAELTWPRDDKGYVHSLGIQPRREDIRGQETEAVVVAGRRSRERGQIETVLSLQYQTERLKLGTTLDSRNEALTTTYGWTQRAVGRGFYPRSGHVTSFQVGGATDALLSDTSFLRLYGRHTQYVSLGRSDRLLARIELGSVISDSRNGIPTDFLFRAGGDNSVRGYGYQSLGRSLDGGVASVRYLATGSLEYNRFFTRDWGMALFVDAGDAADEPNRLDPVFGVGAGVRWRSPVGPVNLDLAYGEATQKLRLHFSLGVSF